MGEYERTVILRVPEELRRRLMLRAKEKGKTLSAYLRDCLEFILKHSTSDMKEV